jgi:hypothetical protein
MTMQIIARWIKAVFNFLVGDIRLLVGAAVALLVVALAARWSPLWAGPLLFVLLAITLALALRREIHP